MGHSIRTCPACPETPPSVSLAYSIVWYIFLFRLTPFTDSFASVLSSTICAQRVCCHKQYMPATQSLRPTIKTNTDEFSENLSSKHAALGEPHVQHKFVTPPPLPVSAVSVAWGRRDLSDTSSTTRLHLWRSSPWGTGPHPAVHVETLLHCTSAKPSRHL